MIRLATLLVLIGAPLALLWTVQRRLIYFPSGLVDPPDRAGVPTAEPVTFDTDDGVGLNAWFVPAAAARSGATLLFLSGNGGNRALRAPLAAALAERGVATLLVDYRGYGGNPGAPSEEGLARDARAALRHLESRPDVDRERIIYFGESLGSGVAVRLAVEHPPRALILRSPFTSLADVGRLHYPFLPVSLLLRDRYSSVDRIGHVTRPLLVIAAKGDTIIPTSLSERLFAAARTPLKELVIVENAGHNDLEILAGQRVIDAIVSFIERVAA